ncbi:MAG TPA: hypothetical protein VFI34_02530, partial [Candidatus Limnocylindrales bacterium]|nr:hypothetical protein [Candidatus Limnocylindrales bacterium]
TERVPVLAWRVGSLTFVVDRTGQVFAPAPKTGARDASGARLPLIVDARAASPGTVAVGRQLDPIDLDAATRLAYLTPGDVGSSATTLTVRVTDDDGWILTTSPPSWTAVFGPYTPVLRTPDVIPAQVRLLRSLIAGREGRYARVVLADGEHGTYLPQPSGGG